MLIRPLHAGDWPALFEAAADPKIWEGHPARDRYQEPVFRKFFDGALKSGGAFVFVERATDAVIGSSRYHGYDPDTCEIEIGWTFLIRRVWGGNANGEIKRLMLAHAFTFADTVLFWVGEQNFRSQKALEKIGGVRRPGLHTRPGSLGAHVIFEITKARFAANPLWKPA